MTPRPEPFASANELAAPQTAHAGLWLDKYLGAQKQGKDTPGGNPPAFKDEKKKEPKALLVEQVAEIGEPDFYESSFARWQAALDEWAAGREDEVVARAHAEVRGRMVVGLGAESVLETSLRLHHTYGVPYIPGSALKGLARAYARDRLEAADWGRDTAAFKIVFGLVPEPNDRADAVTARLGAGYVTFFDALYEPGSGFNKYALHSDVLTVHHQAYYQGQPVAPADWDSPVPVPFLSATGKYLLAVGGPRAWACAALEILALALDEMGVGAKTSSGYGRMTVKTPNGATLARGRSQT